MYNHVQSIGAALIAGRACNFTNLKDEGDFLVVGPGHGGQVKRTQWQSFLLNGCGRMLPIIGQPKHVSPLAAAQGVTDQGQRRHRNDTADCPTRGGLPHLSCHRLFIRLLLYANNMKLGF